MNTKLPTQPPYSNEEVVARGKRYYENSIRQALEAEHNGDYVVINTDTGEYEIDPDRDVVSERAGERWPYAGRYLLKVGKHAFIRFGGAQWRG